MEEKQNVNLIDEDVIEENESNFLILIKLPIIITIILGLLIFALGVINMANGNSSGLLIWLFGCLGCILMYWIIKIPISYFVLHIAYYRHIRD